MKNVMIDLETLGTAPGSVILSLGAVEFNVEHGLGREFYHVIRTATCEAAGLTSDASTIAWWEKQSEDARTVLTLASTIEASPLAGVAKSFIEFLQTGGDPQKVLLWGNGSDFDNVLLIAAFNAVGVKPAWKFYNHRCFRTLKNLVPVTVSRMGTAHNALDDAKYQAACAVEMLRRLEQIR